MTETVIRPTPNPETLQALRYAEGVTYRELGERMGMSLHRLNAIYLGRIRPGVKVLRRIADYYGVTPAELCRLTPRDAEQWEFSARRDAA